MKKKVFFALICLLMLILPQLTLASLGITPAIKELNYKSGLEISYVYRVVEDKPDKILSIYTEGDFAEYVSFDKEELVGGGTFTATLKLPETTSDFGINRLLITVEEKRDEELVGVATRLIISAVIKIHVPYPGRYLEVTSFTAHNANVGSPVEFEFELSNRGKENLTINPRIEIYTLGERVKTLELKERNLSSQGKIKLKKSFDTSNHNAGFYDAMLVADYGLGDVRQNITFRLGSLFVDISNYTKRVMIGELQEFEVEVESNWNDAISEVYANVSFIENSTIKSSFKTSPANLGPWEKAVISRFFDTSNFTEKSYDANITLFYSGETSNEIVKVEFYKKRVSGIGYIIFGCSLLFLVLIIWLIKKYLKNVKKK